MKPRIILLSEDTDDSFRYLSDGWHTIKNCHTAEAKALMAKANAAINAGLDVPDTIRLLEQAGFEVVRDDIDNWPGLPV